MLDRRLGLSESFFHFMHAMGAYVVCVGARMRGPMTEALLIAALARAQARHPLLRVHVVKERGVLRFREDGTTAIPVRSVARTSRETFERAMEEEMARPVADGQTPRLRALLIGPEAHDDAFEIILAMDHAVCDGASVISLLGDLHADLELLTRGGDPPPPVPLAALASVEELLAARGPREPWKHTSEKHDVPLRAQKPPRAPRATRLIFRDLPAHETDALAGRCRAAKTSINGALTAAGLCAMQRVAGGSSRLGLVSNVALRGHIEPAVGSEYVGNFVSFVQTYHAVGPETAFWELSRECKDAIARQIAAGEPERRLGPGQLVWWQRGALRHVAPRIHHGIGNALAVSNTGRLSLATEHGPFTLDAVYAGSAQHVIGSSIAVFVWSIGGAMHLCVGYPEPLVSSDAAARVTEEMMKLLRSP